MNCHLRNGLVSLNAASSFQSINQNYTNLLTTLLASDSSFHSEPYTCQHVKECLKDEPFKWIATIRFCWFSNDQAILFWIFLLILLSLIFYFLVTIASNHFCPNIACMTSYLHLPETVAGVTIAALGNGAPDLFSTFTSFKNGVAVLSIGELLGASFFNALFIIGLISIFYPCSIPLKPYLRDSIFLCMTISFLIYILMDGEIQIFDSIWLMFFYVTYVSVVIIGHFIRNKSLFRSSFKGLFFESPVQLDEETPLVVTETPSPERDEGSSEISADHRASKRSPSLRPSQSSSVIPSIILTKQEEEELYADVAYSMFKMDSKLVVSPHNRPQTSYISPINPTLSHLWHDDFEESDMEVNSDNSQNAQLLVEVEPSLFVKVCNFITTVVTTISELWLIIYFKKLVHFLFGLFIPTVEPKLICLGSSITSDISEESNSETPMEFRTVTLQFLVAILSLGAFCEFSVFIGLTVIMIVLNSLLLLVPMKSSSNSSPDSQSRPPLNAVINYATYNYHEFIVATAGFILAANWIYIMADNIISILLFICWHLNIRESFVGLTLFAFANSSGDLVTNLAMAKSGFSSMAIGASYGSPLLNILLGLGFSSLYSSLVRSVPSQSIESTSSIYLIAIVTIICLVISTIYIYLNNSTVQPRLGYFLLSIWFITNGVVLFNEINWKVI